MSDFLEDRHGWNSVQFAVRLRVIRKKCNLTQEELAYRAGVSRNSIVNLESFSDVKLSTLVSVSNAMSMPLHAWFLPEDEWRKWYDFNIPETFNGNREPAYRCPQCGGNLKLLTDAGAHVAVGTNLGGTWVSWVCESCQWVAGYAGTPELADRVLERMIAKAWEGYDSVFPSEFPPPTGVRR